MVIVHNGEESILIAFTQHLRPLASHVLDAFEQQIRYFFELLLRRVQLGLILNSNKKYPFIFLPLLDAFVQALHFLTVMLYIL